MPSSSRSTGSYATAFARSPNVARSNDYRVTELDISRQEGGSTMARVPHLTEEKKRKAASFASTDGSAYVCWLCQMYGHAMYVCTFFSPEQQMFTAYRNYRCQIETRPGMRNLIQQATTVNRGQKQGYSSEPGRGVRFAPRGGGYSRNKLDPRDRIDFRHGDTRYPRPNG